MSADIQVYPEEWIKSNRCSPQLNCVEINLGLSGLIGVRDSKRGGDAFLVFDAAAWADFLARL